MSLVYSVFVPHPPILVPEIGQGEEGVCRATLAAYHEVSSRLKKTGVDTIVLISPHAQLVEEGITILEGETVVGSFGQFGFPQLRLSFANDLELVKVFGDKLAKAVLRKGALDHGALVPLYFLDKAGWQGKVVLVGMPLTDPERYGRQIGDILDMRQERYALVASGDLSHRLRQDGPYGFHPAGPEFDQTVLDVLKKNPNMLKHIPGDLVESAGECGYRSLRLAVAAKEGVVEVLSYEGHFGVGYLVAELYRSSSLAQWARVCLTHYLSGGDLSQLQLPDSPEFQVKRGCFVTLKKHGELRGCIGTTQARQKNLALEIQHNAIAAGTEDPRFWPVEKEELAQIMFSVDVLGDLEKVSCVEDLDPWRYGVLVRKNGRAGLLLPHLEGVNSVEEQLKIAKQKAGILVHEEVEVWRFEVVRHYE